MLPSIQDRLRQGVTLPLAGIIRWVWKRLRPDRIEHDCLQCGKPLPEGVVLFCSTECKTRYCSR